MINFIFIIYFCQFINSRKRKIDTPNDANTAPAIKYKCPHCDRKYVKIGKAMANHIIKDHSKILTSGKIDDIAAYFNSHSNCSE